MISRIGNNLVNGLTGYRVSGLGWLSGRQADRLTQKAFTLVELLIAAAIFSVVSAAVYSAFSSGMRVWRRAEKIELTEIKSLIKIEKLKRELRQAPFISKSRFFGDKLKIQLSTLNDSDIIIVSYVFDAGAKTLFRSSGKLKDILSIDKDDGEELNQNLAPYLEGVNSAVFSYFYFDIQKGLYLWKEDFEKNNLPIAVKFDIILKDETYASTVFLPTSIYPG